MTWPAAGAKHGRPLVGAVAGAIAAATSAAAAGVAEAAATAARSVSDWWRPGGVGGPILAALPTVAPPLPPRPPPSSPSPSLLPAHPSPCYPASGLPRAAAAESVPRGARSSLWGAISVRAMRRSHHGRPMAAARPVVPLPYILLNTDAPQARASCGRCAGAPRQRTRGCVTQPRTHLKPPPFGAPSLMHVTGNAARRVCAASPCPSTHPPALPPPGVESTAAYGVRVVGAAVARPTQSGVAAAPAGTRAVAVVAPAATATTTSTALALHDRLPPRLPTNPTSSLPTGNGRRPSQQGGVSPVARSHSQQLPAAVALKQPCPPPRDAIDTHAREGVGGPLPPPPHTSATCSTSGSSTTVRSSRRARTWRRA